MQKQIDYCDLVMKGGITSGVVYPLVISELADQYLFKNIGGTSAGAIAAVITAAAEYGRRTGNRDAYSVVKSLPGQLKQKGFLLGLFRPSPSTKKVFRIFLDVLRFQSTFARVAAAIWGTVIGFWYWAVCGALLGAVAPALLYNKYHGSGTPYIILGLLWSFVFAAIVLAVVTVRQTLKSVCGNKFGLCSGFDTSNRTLLTEWLHSQIQLAGGKNQPDDPPLTFGDLWSAPLVPSEFLKTPRTINLQVVTTNLTQGRPHTIPFDTKNFYFDPAELNELFPSHIVEWLVAHVPPSKREVQTPVGIHLLHLPDPQDFPILVAARMSLSFPILLSAVPVYEVDFSLSANANAAPDKPLVAEKCWFSDGGICSNFPIQFFDAPLPRWPTFGIDLKAPHPEHSTEAEMVWLPTKPGSGTQVAWNRFDTGSSRRQILGFFGAIVNTMQNWRDNLQAVSSGYRDRIVHISLRPDEGGLNLNMPPDLIGLLSDRGRRAGLLLKTQFDLGCHIFARYRITMCAMEAYLRQLLDSWTQPLGQDAVGRSYIDGSNPAPCYRPTPHVFAALVEALKDLVILPPKWSANLPPAKSFCEGAPKPEPVLRNQPKF